MKIRFTIFDQEYWRNISVKEFDQWGEVIYGYFEISFGGHAEGQ